MNLFRVENDRYIFQLAPRERDLLVTVLRLYPVIPSAHQPLSKSAVPDKSSQKLLDDALAEQRNENRKWVDDLLSNPRRFQEKDDSVHMSLSAGEIEWLLQVLNDVHVGNWILLGSPEERLRLPTTRQEAAHIWAMELASLFQMELLQALKQSS